MYDCIAYIISIIDGGMPFGGKLVQEYMPLEAIKYIEEDGYNTLKACTQHAGTITDILRFRGYLLGIPKTINWKLIKMSDIKDVIEKSEPYPNSLMYNGDDAHNIWYRHSINGKINNAIILASRVCNGANKLGYTYSLITYLNEDENKVTLMDPTNPNSPTIITLGQSSYSGECFGNGYTIVPQYVYVVYGIGQTNDYEVGLYNKGYYIDSNIASET